MKLWDNNSLELSKIFKKSNLEIRIVGGCVRDYLSNLPINDIDFATNGYPETVTDICEKAGYKVIPTGIDHGTVTVVINKEPYEITTLRKDVATDGRKATISYAETFEEDAMRRDFTFNSMSMDSDGNIYDYFNGKKDLENNIIRFIGEADIRIKEDYLRILRYFRFRTKLNIGNKDINTDIFRKNISTIKNNAYKLNILSGERINSEFQKMLNYSFKNFYYSLILMNEYSILENIGLEKGSIKDYNFFNYNYDLISYPYKLYLLLGTELVTKKSIDNVKNKWKLDNNTYNKLLFIHKNMYLKELNNVYSFKKEGVLNKIKDKDMIEMMVFLNKNDLLTNENENNFIPVFPITGKDLIDIGYKQGAELGNKMNYLKKIWVENNFKLSKENLLEGIDNELGTSFKM